DPAEVWRSASSTDSQNACGSRSSRPTDTHAVLSIRPASPIHDRSNTDFPLPGGAEITVTRADPPSRSNSPVRDTTPPAPGRATRPSTASDPLAGPMTQILARDQPAKGVPVRSGPGNPVLLMRRPETSGRMVRRCEQAEGTGLRHRLRPTVRVQLAAHVADVRADRVHRQGQLAGDLRRGQVGRQISQHADLALAQRLGQPGRLY